jgi:saccharopine dehydrogenase-like NADP-dependent oxidoreductase
MAARHVELDGATAVVLAGTGPVGQRAARLLARQGAKVRVASRSIARSQFTCQAIAHAVAGAEVTAVQASSPAETAAAVEGAAVIIAAGAAGVELLSAAALEKCTAAKVAIDLNAVPPAGIGGIQVMDKDVDRNGVSCYGAIGVGGTKMKIHKAAIKRLFERNDLVLDAEEIYQLGCEIER